jgi:parallel beta-helix repeat protein
MSKMIRRSIAAFVLILIIASLFGASESRQALAMATVAPGESIQAAINEASPGDTILIQSGVHREVDYPIFVNKTITLLGEDAETTIIDGQGVDRQILLVRADGAKILNLTVQNVSQTASGIAGVHLYNVRNAEVVACQISSCDEGMRLTNSSGCNITGNGITGNYETGIYLHANSSYNLITDNTISDNPTGLGAADSISYGNRIYRNNFIGNTNHKGGVGQAGTWHDGYPSGGNYWSGFTSPDLKNGPSQNLSGSDGIVDQSYPGVADDYPLAGPICFFDAGRWNGTDYRIAVTSNSTASDFYFDPSATKLGLNVTGPDGTVGFCRVVLPKGLLWIESGHQWAVSVNQTIANALIIDQYDNNTYLYFAYGQSTQMIEIKGSHAVPEFQEVSILMILTLLLAATVLKRKMARKDPPHDAESALTNQQGIS